MAVEACWTHPLAQLLQQAVFSQHMGVYFVVCGGHVDESGTDKPSVDSQCSTLTARPGGCCNVYANVGSTFETRLQHAGYQPMCDCCEI